jgi:ATP-dependent DNA helicase UvrD/PcrA
MPVPRADPRVHAASPVSSGGVAAFLKGLNHEQRRAVTHGDGPLLVLAGPGTGKTHVVSRRIAWLIATKRARPSEILALTFTDKAADEMQSRVDLLVPYGYVDTAIHTFHAFGDRLVREFAFELGLPREPQVLSRAEATAFVAERLFELGLDRYRPLGDPTRFVRALVGLFSRAKDEDVDVEAYLEYALQLGDLADREALPDDEAAGQRRVALSHESARQRELAVAYAQYQELLESSGRIDFGDQVRLALRLMREHPDVRSDVQGRFRYVIVDEFQDTNPAQLSLLQLVCGARPNLTVVGDDDQSIYTFRGAALSSLLGFERRFGSAERVVLRRNYRSRGPILDAAYRLIRHNDPGRLETRLGVDKRQRAERGRSRRASVEARAFPTTDDEADWIAGAIAERVAKGARPNEFAILTRANADAEAVLRSLNMRGLPWRSGGALALYARPEVRRLLCFLRAVVDPDSTVDLYGLATSEPYGLGGADMTAVLEYARRRHRSLWAACQELEDEPGILRLSDASRRALGRLRGDLRAAMESAHNRPAGEVLYEHLRRSGRLSSLASAGTGEAEEALGDLARFFGIVRDQARLLPDERVTFLLPHLQTLIDAGDDPASTALPDDRDAVAVLTIHKAKGLEFPVVFLVGLADGQFPGRGRREQLALPEALCRERVEAAIDEPQFAEERRLCYVAMTRARDQLFLSYAANGAGRRTRLPSLFLAEVLDRPAPRVPERPQVERLAPPTPAVRRSRRPRPDRGRPLTLSYSQLDDYISCPLRFKLRHVVGLPAPPHHALTYGSALHQAVAAFHQRQRKGSRMSADELLEVFRTHWSGEGFLSREHEEARFAAGEQALRRFHAENDGAAPPLAVEQEFAFQLGRDRIRGRIDRVDATSEGDVITDYKSSDVRDPVKARQRARESLQLAIYALAHEARTGAPPAAVQLQFLESGLIGRTKPDEARLAAAREKIRAAADGIRAGAFEPRPNYVGCSYCPFRQVCPASAAA